MNLVKPGHVIIVATDNAEQLIEKAGRTCYKSESKITAESADKFIKKILKRGHESVIEHAIMSVRFICDRGVTHEIVRHRLAAYSQECISGDTLVTKDKTIKEMFDLSVDKTHPQLQSCNENGRIVHNEITGVFHKGQAEVFHIRTKLGYEIKATSQHEFMCVDGVFRKLSALDVRDSVMVNGRPCLLTVSDTDIKEAYLVEGLSPQEIADKNEVPYRTVLRKLRALGIFEKHLNDKDKSKYSKGYTFASIAKARKSILQQYEDGRQPWNKGTRECDSDAVGCQADALRRYHHNNQSTIGNSNWKGGVSQSYCSSLVPEGACNLCATGELTEIHHIDENRRNNVKENLIRVCVNCHRKLHFGWHVGKKAHLDTIVSIESCGIEDVYDLEMAAPYHNYVANGFVVHNSTRYCNYGKAGKLSFIVPCWLDIDPGDVTSSILMEESTMTKDQLASAMWVEHMLVSERCYLKLLTLGWTPQQARSVLPNSLKTEIVMTANFREWRHVFKLRCAKAAHPQMVELMTPLYESCMIKWPSIFGGL